MSKTNELTPREELLAFPLHTTVDDWMWKAENFVRWVESGVLLKTHKERVDFLSGEYQQIYTQGVTAGTYPRSGAYLADTALPPSEWLCECQLTLPRNAANTADGYLRCVGCKRVYTTTGKLVEPSALPQGRSFKRRQVARLKLNSKKAGHTMKSPGSAQGNWNYRTTATIDWRRRILRMSGYGRH